MQFQENNSLSSSFWDKHLKSKGLVVSESAVSNIKPVGRHLLHVSGKVTLDLDFGSQLYSVDFLVVNDSTYNGILERDFLQSYCSSIDVINQCFYLRNGEPVINEVPEDNYEYFSVHATSTVLLPAQSEQ